MWNANEQHPFYLLHGRHGKYESVTSFLSMHSPDSALLIVPACFPANAIPVHWGSLSRYQLLFYLSWFFNCGDQSCRELREDVPLESHNLMLLGHVVCLRHLSCLGEDWLHLKKMAEVLLHRWAHGWVPLTKKKVKMKAAVLSKDFSNPREERDWLFFSLPFFFSTNC